MGGGGGGGETGATCLPSIHLQQNRRLMTYTPLNHQTQNLPLIILQDGVAYYRFAKIHLTLEKLLAEQKIRPAHLLFLEPLDRSLEYPYFEPYQHFVVEEALPFIQDKLPLTGEKILMGASLSGSSAVCCSGTTQNTFIVWSANLGLFGFATK
ncbi:MAG: alpha/beta hydrolase-fold protein [Deinococcales bacterium]